MKLNTLLVCLVFVFSYASDSLAQFTPVVAKIKITETGSNGEQTKRQGFYYRSSAGDVMMTKFPVKENGEKLSEGLSFYVNASTGATYVLSNVARKAKIRQQRPLPLLPLPLPPPDQIIEEAVINGVSCVAVPITNHRREKTGGKVWISTDSGVHVRMESYSRGSHLVQDLYDIQFTEPDPSKFGIPPDYIIDKDLSECRGCKHD